MRKKYFGLLTPKEEEIMNFFWEHGKLFVKDLLDLIPEPKPHFNTISTFVRALEEKGYLSHEESGNSYCYFPLLNREQFHNESLKGVIGKYYNNSILSAVSSLVEEEAISVEDLKKLIYQVEKGNKKI